MSANLDYRLSLLTQPVVATFEQKPLSTLQTHFGRQYKVIESDNEPCKASSCKCYIIPPHISDRLRQAREQNEDLLIQEHAYHHQESDDYHRHMREIILKHPNIEFEWPHHSLVSERSISSNFVERSVFDAHNAYKLPGKLIMKQTAEKTKGSSSDPAVLSAMENASNVFLFYLNNYKHHSIDGKNMPIVSTVHYGRSYENAFWDGTEMIYGDGSELFDSFVNYLDVVGHELTHGVTSNRLAYKGESGALNEHFSDVMGYLVWTYTHQYKIGDSQLTWNLADGIIKDGNKRYPLRSFAHPGEAYDTPSFGKDPQMPKYQDRYLGKEDNGGVHINSGIPNHAFYLFATQLGGAPWEKAGLIWFTAMMTKGAFKPNATMAEFANVIIKTADQLFPNDTTIYNAIRTAWKTVGVIL